MTTGPEMLIHSSRATIWTNAGILSIGPLGTKSNEILYESHAFPFINIHLKMPSGKWRPFYLGLNVLKQLWIRISAPRDNM